MSSGIDNDNKYRSVICETPVDLNTLIVYMFEL
jgi:hypothetical protein